MNNEPTGWPDGDADEDTPRPRNRRRGQRRKQRVDPQSLERWAVRHLNRYSSSAANLRLVLLRRVRRVEHAQEESFPEAHGWIDAAVEALKVRGYLDDRRYARNTALRMRERGVSARRIESQLSSKGIPFEVAREAVAEVSGDSGELDAAVKYARRRRLGAFRLDPDTRAERRERDLAALGRSGFSFDIALAIVEAPDSETLESRASGRD